MRQTTSLRRSRPFLSGIVAILGSIPALVHVPPLIRLSLSIGIQLTVPVMIVVVLFVGAVLLLVDRLIASMREPLETARNSSLS